MTPWRRRIEKEKSLRPEENCGKMHNEEDGNEREKKGVFLKRVEGLFIEKIFGKFNKI
jgi:hypothetical protein